MVKRTNLASSQMLILASSASATHQPKKALRAPPTTIDRHKSESVQYKKGRNEPNIVMCDTSAAHIYVLYIDAKEWDVTIINY